MAARKHAPSARTVDLNRFILCGFISGSLDVFSSRLHFRYRGIQYEKGSDNHKQISTLVTAVAGFGAYASYARKYSKLKYITHGKLKLCSAALVAVLVCTFTPKELNTGLYVFSRVIYEIH